MNPDGSEDVEFDSAVNFFGNAMLVPAEGGEKVLLIGMAGDTTPQLFRLHLRPQHFAFRAMTRLSATEVNVTVNGRDTGEGFPANRFPLVEASNDLVSWSEVPRSSAPVGGGQAVFEFVDANAPSGGSRFYRARRQE
jgi:hypothetical protein